MGAWNIKAAWGDLWKASAPGMRADTGTKREKGEEISERHMRMGPRQQECTGGRIGVRGKVREG